MSPQFYHILHIVGVMLLFTSIGGMLATSQPGAPARRLVGILHGVALLILLVAGFGWLAKAGGVYPAWVWIKVALWAVLGMLPALVKRKRLPAGLGVALGLLIGVIAAYIGYFKPPIG
jgi:hypothetical protein